MDVVTLGQANLAALRRFLGKSARASSLPAGLGWDSTNFPVTPSLYDVPGSNGRALGVCSLTAAAAFNAKSTALTAPSATYYVDVTNGNDSTGTGAVGAPFKSIWKGVSAGNAAGVPTKVIVLASSNPVFTRANSPSFGSVWPTVDMAILASGGRINTGMFDNFTATADGTNVYTYTVAVTASTVNRVVDTVNRTRFGNYVELVKVADAATCNVTPGSWAHVSGTLYIHRADGAAVTQSNTRYYRTGGTSFYVSATNVNVFIGGVSGNDGFDVEGGHVNGVLTTGFSTGVFGTSDHVLAVANCTFKYGGGAIDSTVGRGVSVDSWRGLAIFENCRADANMTDGFNFHNSFGAAKCLVLTVNCTGLDNGRASNVSNNGLTLHDDIVAIDIAGFYEGNRGGTLRSINTSRHLLVGTTLADDLGDVMFGGTITPTALALDDTAQAWCDRVRIRMPAGAMAYTTRGAGAQVHRRDCWPVAQPDHGPGTFDTY